MVTHSKNKNRPYFVVAIGRDQSLLGYCNPDLSITINRTASSKNFKTIALSDFVSSNKFLPLYDSDLMAILNNQEEIVKWPAGIKIGKSIQEFKKAVFKYIENYSDGRQVVINPYYSSHTQEFRKRKYIIIGPADKYSYQFSRKVVAFRLAKRLGIPTPQGRILKNIFGAKKYISSRKFSSGFFIASDDDPFYPINKHLVNQNNLCDLPNNIGYLVTGWIKNSRSLNSQVIIGVNKILYLGVTDQIIRQEVKYYGNIYPSQSSKQSQDIIKKHSLSLASEMQFQGYRGICGFDWLEDGDQKVYLIEINPRKNRSSGMLFATLDSSRTKKATTIFEQELKVAEGKSVIFTKYILPKNIYWQMELIKVDKELKIEKSIKSACWDFNIFSKKNCSAGILNFPLKNSMLNTACPEVARIIAVGKNRQAVDSKITFLKNKINKTLIKKI